MPSTFNPLKSSKFVNVAIQKPYTHMIIIDIYVGFIFDSTFNLKFSQSLIITIYINTINDLYRLHSLKLRKFVQCKNLLQWQVGRISWTSTLRTYLPAVCKLSSAAFASLQVDRTSSWNEPRGWIYFLKCSFSSSFKLAFFNDLFDNRREFMSG